MSRCLKIIQSEAKRKSTKKRNEDHRPVGHHIAKQHRWYESYRKAKEAEKILEDIIVKTPQSDGKYQSTH